jgi:PadR family transcriptional regulator
LDALQDTHKKFRKELSAGTVSLVLLSLLDQAEAPMYGYQIGRLIGAGDGDSTMVKQGAIYPVLRSLEGRGLLSSEREASLDGPPRRYYRVTEVGHEALKGWQLIWAETKAFVDNALGGEFK